MIYSMTGFGRGSAPLKGKKITLELKSLNSKQLDLSVKVPSRYRELEKELRNLLVETLERGKVEAIVTVEHTGEESPQILNKDVIARYKSQIEDLDKDLEIAPPTDWHQVLLRLPDVFKGEDLELTDEEKAAFAKAAGEAAEGVMEFRRQEGEKLMTFFRQKIENIRNLLQEIEPYEEERVPKIRARLQEQLEKLTSIDYDKGRLEQELIFYIERLDVSEEKQRLISHLDYFIQTIGGDEDESQRMKGKKLGFISQEMGREINTLGSKSNNAEMQIIVVKMKDELEQIKEQVLNVL